MKKHLNKSDSEKNPLRLVILLVCVLCILFVTTCKKAPAPTKELAEPPKETRTEPTKFILRSTLSGSWYPADAGTLSKQIEGFFEKAEVEPINNVIAFILPHAGYQFSGQTAAFAPENYRQKI